jgi:hypothetical protein
MVELNLNDIITRLRDLKNYSPQLARRMEHEDGLAEDAAAFLINKIESAILYCENATTAEEADAHEELTLWLSRSYQYYLQRLATADHPWIFRFPKSEELTHH